MQRAFLVRGRIFFILCHRDEDAIVKNTDAETRGLAADPGAAWAERLSPKALKGSRGTFRDCEVSGIPVIDPWG